MTFIARSSYIVLLLLLGGCASQSPSIPESITEDTLSDTRSRILRLAESLLGAPYRWGGHSPSGMDCSGLVYYVYSRAGVSVPRTTIQLYRNGKSLDRAMPGDLLFFRLNSNPVSHVGIYAGNNQMIHASSSKRKIRKVSLENPYWRKHLVSKATFLACGQC